VIIPFLIAAFSLIAVIETIHRFALFAAFKHLVRASQRAGRFFTRGGSDRWKEVAARKLSALLFDTSVRVLARLPLAALPIPFVLAFEKMSGLGVWAILDELWSRIALVAIGVGYSAFRHKIGARRNATL
jgi:hypothetical protein